MIGKQKMEDMCRAAGMKPVQRTSIDGVEIFIADGSCATPAVTFQKFGVDADDFPGGCYATMWWAAYKDEKLDVGRPLFFDLFHNPEFSSTSKQYARINAAVNDAKTFLDRRKKVRH